MYQQARGQAGSPADEEGTWDSSYRHPCAAELRAEGAGASLYGFTETIVRLSGTPRVNC